MPSRIGCAETHAQREDAQRDLALYADQLEGSNRGLARSVERLEAFAEIARAVGGETDLERILSLILAHGREVVAARTLVIYLPDGGELAAVSGSARSVRTRSRGCRSTARSPARCCSPGARAASGPRRTAPSSSSSLPMRPRRSSCR